MPELYSVFGNSYLTFLVGSDVVRTFPHRWAGLDTLLSQVSLAIGMRAHDKAGGIAAIMTQVKRASSIAPRYVCINAPDSGLASSRIRNGSADASLLPSAEMLNYINRHGLYPHMGTARNYE